MTLTVVSGLLFLRNLSTKSEIGHHPTSKMSGMVQTVGTEGLTVEAMHH